MANSLDVLHNLRPMELTSKEHHCQQERLDGCFFKGLLLRASLKLPAWAYLWERTYQTHARSVPWIGKSCCRANASSDGNILRGTGNVWQVMKENHTVEDGM